MATIAFRHLVIVNFTLPLSLEFTFQLLILVLFRGRFLSPTGEGWMDQVGRRECECQVPPNIVTLQG